jgi:hypothetical protein
MKTRIARIVWIAAEIDSKLEASREAAEFWCDRLEVAAAMCKFERSRSGSSHAKVFRPRLSKF